MLHRPAKLDHKPWCPGELVIREYVTYEGQLIPPRYFKYVSLADRDTCVKETDKILRMLIRVQW
jgi:hypothetical protein